MGQIFPNCFKLTVEIPNPNSFTVESVEGFKHGGTVVSLKTSQVRASRATGWASGGFNWPQVILMQSRLDQAGLLHLDGMAVGAQCLCDNLDT